ncbi:uncharacterized protein V1513DRAFT_453503 [Lipomyces chichibuensis]|uniref:uncharacterized protein n=1 Tax=Lipomyces chichibuensis TaxID=1546026 RepID=UPI0033441ADC
MWHFRQAVLANMTMRGEQSFETDFPPGTDMLGEILSGPAAAKRMDDSPKLIVASNCSEDE